MLNVHRKNRNVSRIALRRYRIFGILLLCIVDLMLIGMVKMEYEHKIDLIASMLNQEGELSYTTKILKGSVDVKEAAKQGKETLEQYGYLQGTSNALFEESRNKVIYLLIGTTLIYGIYEYCLIHIYSSSRRERRQELLQLSNGLEQLAMNLYESNQFHTMYEQDDIWKRIYDQLQSLSDVIKLNHSRLYQEKEETKTLVTDISHQLKTPVAALKTCFDVLNQQNLSEEEREEFALRCSKQLEGLEVLLKALLSISRMEVGMIAIHKEPECLFETIATAVSRVYGAADQKGISIEMDADENMQQVVCVHDKHWMSEAIINILENAIKYSPEHSKIQIRLLQRVSFLRIEIEDEGIGIPKSEYHKIFQRFYRGQSQEVKNQSGSGVGLYLTREILQRHGGSVMVTSQQGFDSKNYPGTTFILQLPCLTKL